MLPDGSFGGAVSGMVLEKFAPGSHFVGDEAALLHCLVSVALLAVCCVRDDKKLFACELRYRLFTGRPADGLSKAPAVKLQRADRLTQDAMIR